MNYLLTQVSGNAKTGPIPTVIISKESCPKSCPLSGNGCYAENSFLGMCWKQITNGVRGVSFSTLILLLRTLSLGSLWRYAVAGDLPGKGDRINGGQLTRLVAANKAIKGRGFTYTHKDPELYRNKEYISKANANGLTINLSSNNLCHADELLKLGIGPVVTLLPSDSGSPKEVSIGGKVKLAREWGQTRTPKNNVVIQCPAEYSNVQCINCGNGRPFCQRVDRKFIVGFTSHGVRKTNVDSLISLGHRP